MKRTAEATTYADALTRLQAADGSIFNNQTTALSVTLSNGTDLTLETTALAIQVWNNNAKYATNIASAASFLFANIDQGLIGGSQATIQSLKSIASYMA